MARKKQSDDFESQFIDTPAGIFTSSGNWFHITSSGLRTYAPGLFEKKSIGEVIRDAEAWIRSSDHLSVLIFMTLLLTTSIVWAALISLIFLPLWHTNKSALASPNVAVMMRILDKEFVVVLAAVVALSLLGMNAAYYDLLLGFLFFFLFKFGWYRKLIDQWYERKSARKLTLNDRLLRMLVVKYAQAEGEPVAEVAKMEKDFLTLINQHQEKNRQKKKS